MGRALVSVGISFVEPVRKVCGGEHERNPVWTLLCRNMNGTLVSQGLRRVFSRFSKRQET